METDPDKTEQDGLACERQAFYRCRRFPPGLAIALLAMLPLTLPLARWLAFLQAEAAMARCAHLMRRAEAEETPEASERISLKACAEAEKAARVFSTVYEVTRDPVARRKLGEARVADYDCKQRSIEYYFEKESWSWRQDFYD